MNLESKKLSSTKTWILISVGFIAEVGAAWTLRGELPKADQGVPVPGAFTVKSIKQEMDKPEEMMKLFSTQYNQLTDKQRQQAGQDKGRAFRQMWQDRVDEYLQAGETDREAILDRHLDEFMTRMDQ